MAYADPKGKEESDRVAEEFVKVNGYKDFVSHPNPDGGNHYTAYNEFQRASWDTTPSGDYKPEREDGKPSYHETETKPNK